MLLQKNNSISFIFPCFNEEKRILHLLNSIILFLKKNETNSDIFEFIIINDGSYDKTENLIKKNKLYKNHNFKLISYKENKGKGYALMRGIKIAKFEWAITLDTDLSVDLDEAIQKFNLYLSKNYKVYFGSRNLPSSKTKKTFLRFIIGSLFNFLIKIFLKIQLKDTQCGFKIYHQSIKDYIFDQLTDMSYSHDLEIAIICKIKKINILEIPVNWTHQSGSKVNILKDGFKMFLNILTFKKIYKI